MRKPLLGLTTALTVLALLAVTAPLRAQNGPLPRPQIWGGCELYNTVVTPATFNPASEPFDKLYGGGTGFADGIPLISESEPGDRDYNGGRWEMLLLKPWVDPGKYADACSAADLDPDDFMVAGAYFECPLIPIRD